MKGLNWRITVVILTVFFAVYLLIPSYLKFAHNIQMPKVAKQSDPWYYSILPSQVLKLGLDLRGGVHLVLGIDFQEVHKDALVKLKGNLDAFIKEEKISQVSTELNTNGHLVINYPNNDVWEKIDDILSQNFSGMIDFVEQTNKMAELTMSTFYEKEVRDRAIEQSLETLRNRIDEFGIAEPIIQRHGDDKILVQFPGVQQVGRLKDIISRTAKLTFQIVVSGPEVPDGPPPQEQLSKWVDEFTQAKNLKLTDKKPITRYLIDLNKYLASKLPKGTELLFSKQVDVNTKEASYIPYLLEIEPIVTGEELDDAYYGFKPDNNEPIVNFSLNPMGASRFEKGTGEHVNDYMAIVLDRNVHSAPNIRSRIGGGRAIIEMGGGTRGQQEILQDAKDTALVLRSGALPAKLEFLEERTVGPSLGLDAILAGTESLALGLALVLIFMGIYYRGAGTVAIIALVLNALFILAGLSAFEGTLTLPGLAGVTLTMGMAIDANVLIFEHVREELRAGKTVNMAIAEGYRRAFSAIFDSNFTTIMAAVVLLNFGYGPIRGFAITLIIGLVGSMYTAVFVTRVIIDYFIVSKGKKTISI